MPGCSCSRRWSLYAVFVLFPIVQAARYSLYDWNGLEPLDRLRRAGQLPARAVRPVFQGAVGHNAFIVVLSLAIQIPFALGLALMLNRRFRGRAVLRLIFFAPYVIAEVITGDRLEPDPPAERPGRRRC